MRNARDLSLDTASIDDKITCLPEGSILVTDFTDYTITAYSSNLFEILQIQDKNLLGQTLKCILGKEAHKQVLSFHQRVKSEIHRK